eukprot:scaffold91544_cov21-Tisochrysis_lutea.AAC.1
MQSRCSSNRTQLTAVTAQTACNSKWDAAKTYETQRVVAAWKSCRSLKRSQFKMVAGQTGCNSSALCWAGVVVSSVLDRGYTSHDCLLNLVADSTMTLVHNDVKRPLCNCPPMSTGTGKTQLAHSLLGNETWQVVDPILGASKDVT